MAEIEDELDGELPGPRAQPPKRAAGTLRFAAHMGLALCALGLVPPPHDTDVSLRHRDLQVPQKCRFHSHFSHIRSAHQSPQIESENIALSLYLQSAHSSASKSKSAERSVSASAL